MAHGALALMLAVLLMLDGCTAAAALTYKIVGPPDIEAKYHPAKEPLLVMVENYRRPSAALSDSNLLARYIEQNLNEHKTVPIVSTDKVYELKSSRPEDFRKMTVAEIGRELGARQILYVDLTDTTIEPMVGGEALRGSAAARVRMIDAATGQTLWPVETTDGYPVDESMQWGHITDPRSEVEIKQELYQTLGWKVARLFYKWKPEHEEPSGFVAQ
jgi:hypothetical protein